MPWKRGMCEAWRLTGEHPFLCRANEACSRPARRYSRSSPAQPSPAPAQPSPAPCRGVGSGCENGAHTRAPSNCDLPQPQCRGKQWIRHSTWMSCGSTLHVSPVCHGHGCCHGEAPCSGNVWSLPDGTQPPAELPMPVSVFWKLSTADNAVTGFLSRSFVGRREKKITWRKLKKKYPIPGVCMCGL